jgi:phosphatidylglycerophosphate synthase
VIEARMSFFSAVGDAYRRTRKPKDIFWNRFVARPAAAVLLVPLERAPVTPNQVTFASLLTFAAGAAVLLAVPGWPGLLLAVAIIELSYVLDCVDGQLARMRGTSTPVGAHLDFLMDEL